MKYLIDLDGTLMNGDEAIPGAKDFIMRLNENSQEFLIMTNSVRTPSDLSTRLARGGMEVPPEKIINPVTAVNWELDHLGYTKVFAVGSQAELEQLHPACVNDDPEAVVFLDFERCNASFSVIQKACDLMLSGIPAYAASGSPFYLKQGRKILDTGSFVKMLENVTGRTITVLGKPSVEYFKIAGAMLGAGEITVFGDDFSTDITGAISAGYNAVLLGTGKYQPGDEKKLALIRFCSGLTDFVF